jgi:hypothetical protein
MPKGHEFDYTLDAAEVDAQNRADLAYQDSDQEQPEPIPLVPLSPAIRLMPRFAAVLAEALAQSGCDGDLCAHAWHEKARNLLDEIKEAPSFT